MQNLLKSKGWACTKIVIFALFLLQSTFAWAQTKVSGVVTDANGEPLIGVSVVEKGTTNGGITDLDGRFSVNVAQGKTLRFSYIGYATQEVVVKGSTMKVVLEEDTKMLDDVVVIGYGAIQRKDVTSSISTVKAEDFNVGAYTDAGQLLQGKVPGLVVVQNSDPNGGVNSLTLRGASTLNGSTEPLYVVDGIPGVNMNLVSPSDIESIDDSVTLPPRPSMAQRLPTA